MAIASAQQTAVLPAYNELSLATCEEQSNQSHSEKDHTARLGNERQRQDRRDTETTIAPIIIGRVRLTSELEREKLVSIHHVPNQLEISGRGNCHHAIVGVWAADSLPYRPPVE